MRIVLLAAIAAIGIVPGAALAQSCAPEALVYQQVGADGAPTGWVLRLDGINIIANTGAFDVTYTAVPGSREGEPVRAQDLADAEGRPVTYQIIMKPGETPDRALMFDGKEYKASCPA